jgi:hypothetical protein
MSEGIATEISPVPSDEEAVVITAAVQAMWPGTVVVVDGTPPPASSWRFSGRWWAKPLPQRRDRPFR